MKHAAHTVPASSGRPRPSGPLVLALIGGTLAAAVSVAQVPPGGPRTWLPLAKDGLHDPTNPGLRELQEPGDALSKLPPDSAGNMVRWMEALQKGDINPRANIRPGTPVETRDDEILLNLRGGTPIVRFPHGAHTLWLDCSNCHEALFKSKIGANKFSMFQMLQGEQCGVCHGAVSFPLTECNRCHSVSRIGAAAPGKAP